MASSHGGGIQEFFKSIPFDDLKHYYQHAVDFGVVDVILHPFDYADVLIRLGYEPFPPVQENRLFHGKSLVLPGVISYAHYLYSVIGVNGMFCAVVPYVTSSLIYRHLSNCIVNHAPFPLEDPSNEPRLCIQFTDGNIGHFVKVRLWRLLSNVVALHVAYPFQVIAVRTMARFVTTAATTEGYRPEMAESWIGELRHLKGIDELFAGCQARVIKEVLFAVISASAFAAIMKIVHLAKADPEQADSLEHSVEYLTNSIATMYSNPFRNASDIMIINKTDIPLGNPPFNKHYTSCMDCCKNLETDRKWKTSSSAGMFQSGRYYTGPVDIHEGRLLPKGTFFGPVYLPMNVQSWDDIPHFLKGHYDAWKEVGGIQEAGRYGVLGGGEQGFKVMKGEDMMGRQDTGGNFGGRGGPPGRDSVYDGTRPLLSERIPLDILGNGPSRNNFYFYGTSNNPFGL